MNTDLLLVNNLKGSKKKISRTPFDQNHYLLIYFGFAEAHYWHIKTKDLQIKIPCFCLQEKWLCSQTAPQGWDPGRISRSPDLSLQATYCQQTRFPETPTRSDFDLCLFDAVVQGALERTCFTTLSFQRNLMSVWYGGAFGQRAVWAAVVAYLLISFSSTVRRIFFFLFVSYLTIISPCLSLILSVENVPMCCLQWIFEWVSLSQLVLLAFWCRLVRRKEKELDSGLQNLKPPHFSSPLINSLVYLPVTMTNDATSWCYHIWQSQPSFELGN